MDLAELGTVALPAAFFFLTALVRAHYLDRMHARACRLVRDVTLRRDPGAGN